MAHFDEEMNITTIELVVAKGNEQGFRERAVFAAALVASLLVVAVTSTTRPRSEDDALLFSRVLQSKGDTGLWGSTHSADMPTAARIEYDGCTCGRTADRLADCGSHVACI
jgi:hypothetical protein